MLKKILVASVLVLPMAAFAALPAGVSTAIGTATTDGTDLGYQLLTMAVVVGTIFWLKRKA